MKKNTFIPKILLLLVIYLFTPFSVAVNLLEKFSEILSINSCKNQDNRRFPLSHHIRNQSDTNWDYAYVVADLLSHKLGRLVSAVDIFNTFNNSNQWQSNEEKVFNLTEIKRVADRMSEVLGVALKVAIDKGVCPEEYVKSSGFTFERNSGLGRELRKFEDLKIFFDNQVDSIPSQKCNEGCRVLGVHNKFDSIKEIFNLKDQQILEILKTTLEPSDVINKAITESCKGKRIEIKDRNIKIVKKKIDRKTSVKNLLKKINTQLNKGNIISVVYDSSYTLLDTTIGELTGVVYDSEDTLLTEYYVPKDMPIRGSSIVARKFDEKSNSCKYLLRNSLGKECNIYQNKYECEKGQIWLSTEDLKESLMAITYITN